MSSLSKLEKLMYSIGVVDKATGPVNKIMAKINQLSSQAGNAQNQMMKGFMGAAGGAMMLVGSLNPAIAANQSLGEVKSLGVAEQSLQQLNNTSIDFTAKYGGNAADVISASYDIQSSIAGLTGNELSAFTNASAIMAKGTKSDASTATNYLGTMYGIYQDNANAVGKTQWVEQLAGQTATAVKMFKTNGNEMSGAFTSLGASAQSHGVDMAESMAVLGQLQATMSGSEAGTKYKAFLAGVGNAQKMLGVQMTDAQGRLLPMTGVLDALHNKFGLIDTVAKSDALKKAFGSDEATGLIKLLLPQVAQLKNNINDLNQQTGMQTAVDMANAQTDAWKRLSGGFNSAATSLGQAVLPIIEPVVEMLGTMLRGVIWLSREFPTLTGILATTVVGITGLIVAMGIMNMAIGFSKFGMIGYSTIGSGVIKTLGALSKVTNVWTGALWLKNKALASVRASLLSFHLLASTSGGTFGAFKAILASATRSVFLFNAALLMNPISLVIAVVAGLAIAVYKYWQPIKAFISGMWEGFKIGFGPVSDIFSSLGESFSFVGDIISWIGTQVNFSSSELQGFANAGVFVGIMIGKAFKGIAWVISGVAELIGNVIGKVIEAAGWVSGLFGEDTEIKASKSVQNSINSISTNEPAILMQQKLAANSNVVPFNKAMLNAEKNETQKRTKEHSTIGAAKIEKSEFASQLSNSLTSTSNSDNSKRVYIDSVTMKSDNLAQDFEQLLEMAG